MRHSFVYRLHVTYPEGIDWRNPPENWVEPEGSWGEVAFHWPKVRHYLSAHAANRRAELLRHYGCVVTIERSRPVEWAPDEVNEEGS